jgi:hypothetical protein
MVKLEVIREISISQVKPSGLRRAEWQTKLALNETARR